MSAATATLAVRSLRRRPAAVTATFLAAFLGTVLMGSFATLVETALHTDGDDRQFLVIMGAVVGGWSALIVLFSIASTVGITATQRARETGLVRAVGATPRQALGLVLWETLAVTVLAAALGAAVAAATGRRLLDALRDGGLVGDGTTFAGGPVSLGAAAAAVVLVGLLAAWLAGRRASAGPVVRVLREQSAEARRLPRWRVAAGVVLVGYGAGLAVVTTTVGRSSDDVHLAQETAGPAGIVVAVGLAVLAPWLLGVLAAPARTLAGRSAAGHLAASNATRRAPLLAGVLAPVIVLVATATGTLLMVGVDERTLDAAGDPAGMGETITLLNYVVSGMVCLFAAIMVVNAFAAVVTARRGELHRLWLVGATRPQIRRALVGEAAIVGAVGVVLGTVAAAATSVSYAVARGEGVLPDGQLWLVPAVAAGAAAVTLGSAWACARRVVR